jgi:hypothetical protein
LIHGGGNWNNCTAKLTSEFETDAEGLKLKTLGMGLYWIGVIATLIVDFFSLSLLASQEGIGWAIAAFLFIPAQLFVPFYVGTWHLALVAIIILLVGYVLSREQLAK